MELHLSDSESSSDTIVNTSTEVLDGDDNERDIEMLHDDNVRDIQLEDNVETATVPDPICENDGEEDLILGDNEEMVDELVLDPDQEAEEYIQQHSPEIN